ncbi:hypothetical protein GCM10011507_12570 [Edaphobacter acidisoli]|uniref:JmjC domain-containing protein n=1 Tax=Edaphobacter acidisoli TaxID=2040573 RepID=A0A916RN95_9BACT|nr:cupin domain-containing protein [Edaphobacter acidisoli]GGA62522.1 hypothetical protein GCM10011507_12570 [Edaphobacter acidisoli]
MANQPTRRTFLKAAPLAAAALPMTDKLLLAASAPAPSTPVPFQLFTAQKLDDAMKALQAKPGNDNLFEAKSLPFTVVMTLEEHKSAKEFEYHEGRDHVFLILDGTTRYDVGGTPKNPRKIRPGEWLAPESEGSTALTLNKGDMLVLPRGTPHKRITEASVTLILIATTGAVPA